MTQELVRGWLSRRNELPAYCTHPSITVAAVTLYTASILPVIKSFSHRRNRPTSGTHHLVATISGPVHLSQRESTINEDHLTRGEACAVRA